MKKILAILALAIMPAISVLAQDSDDYAPSTSWPYLYHDFTSGSIRFNNGQTAEGQYNIHLGKETLQFIDGEFIKEAASGDVLAVQIGADSYINAGGHFRKVVASNDHGTVIVAQEVDFVKLNASGAAYGSSGSTLGNMTLTSLEGIGGTRSNMNHIELMRGRSGGQTLPLIEKLYLFGPKFNVFANKVDVSRLDGLDANAWKQFQKENKIKWKDAESLLLVVDFLSENLK